MYQVMESGWECNVPQDRFVNDDKIYKNLARARDAVFEYAYCNSWDWFFTGTIDPSKHMRNDLDGFEKKFTQMIRNDRKRKGYNLQYLIVPELHADYENWHCHGLIQGLPKSELSHFTGNRYNWDRFTFKFGFNSLEPIRNHEAVSKYMTKYITKCFNDNRSVSDKEKHLYLVSRGLKRGEVVKKGSILEEIDRKPKVANKYCEVFEFDLSDLDYLISLYQD